MMIRLRQHQEENIITKRTREMDPGDFLEFAQPPHIYICQKCPDVSRSPRARLYTYMSKGKDDANDHNIFQIGMVRREVGCERESGKAFQSGRRLGKTGAQHSSSKRVSNIWSTGILLIRSSASVKVD